MIKNDSFSILVKYSFCKDTSDKRNNVIMRKNIVKKILLRYLQLKTIVLIYLFKTFSLFAKTSHWVICERGTDARDNGYWFYRYLKTNHPEQKVYYIIDKNSTDYQKVQTDAILYGSVRNYWVVASAKKIISSHYAKSLPPIVGERVLTLCGLHKKYYFLQHGVIKDNITGLHASCAPMRLFVCGAKPEYNFVLRTFGHTSDVIKYTGLARYDQLHDFKVKKQILLMPTWRMNIRSQDDFLHSDYFAQWQKVLSDKELAKQLEQNDVKLVLYVHYEMQKYCHLFAPITENMIVARFEEYDVQILLKESAVLVTDFSSVFFDFAYMKKPMLFFQFDKDNFYLNHYEKGYFDYESMGFGRVFTESENVTTELIRMIKNNFEIEQMYLDRMRDFFPLHDKNNCQRIYDVIVKDDK